MILALLGYWIFSMFSGATPLPDVLGVVQERVESAVGAGERRDRLVEILERAADQLEVGVEAARPLKEDLLAAIRAHDTPRARILGLLGDLSRARGDIHSQFVDLRFALRDELSREEWNTVFFAP